MGLIRWAVFVLLLCCSAAHAQDTSCLRRLIPVTVVDHTGTPVHGVTSADFRVEMHGKPVQIVAVSNRGYPHRILILIAARGNMKGERGEDTWKTAVSVAGRLAESKPPDTSLALYIFGERANERAAFSEGNDAVLKKLREIESDPEYAKKRVWGRSAMRDAMLEGISFFGTPRAGDEMFVITTTHGDNASKTGMNSIQKAFDASGIRAFFCALSTPLWGGPTPAEQGGIDEMLAFAEDTGGGVIGPHSYWTGVSPFTGNRYDRYQYCPPFGRPTPPDGSVLSRAIIVLYDQMTSSQRIEITLGASLRKRQKWKLMFSKEASSRFRRAQVVYPHYLQPCRAANSN